jgi:hypothetical protein
MKRTVDEILSSIYSLSLDAKSLQEHIEEPEHANLEQSSAGTSIEAKTLQVKPENFDSTHFKKELSTELSNVNAEEENSSLLLEQLALGIQKFQTTLNNFHEICGVDMDDKEIELALKRIIEPIVLQWVKENMPRITKKVIEDVIKKNNIMVLPKD